MRKLLLVFIAFLVLASCGGSNKQREYSDEEKELLGISVDTTSKVSQLDFIQSMLEQGVDNFRFEKDYLIYAISRSEISANPDWVAKQWYDMATNVENIRGCRLVDENGKEFGRYEP